MADYIPPELDPSSRAAIDAIHQRSLSENDEAIARKTMENTGAPGLIDNPAAQIRDEHLAPEGRDEAMLKAINQRASNKYESSMRGLGIKAKHEAAQTTMQRKMRAVDLLSKEQAYNEQVRQMRLKAEADRKAARAATIGAIMGTAGAIGGAMLGGGAGAVAGYQIGSGTGQTVGQNQGD